MKKKEVYFYLGLILFCLIYLYSAASALYSGTISSPGPGFVPIIVGSMGLIISSILFSVSIRSIFNNKNLLPSDDGEKDIEKVLITNSFRKLIFFIAIMAGYIYLFNIVDFVLNTFILMVILAKLFGLEGWKKPIAMGGAFVGAVYILFTKLCRIYF